VGSKTLLQQNHPVVNWGCWLTLCNDCITSVIVGRTRIEVPPQNTTVNPFDLFAREQVLRCVAASDPSTPPLVTWYRLTSGTATRVNTGGSDRLSVRSDGSLVFRGVVEMEWCELIGWYRCVANNGYTSDSAEAFLDMLTSPPVPTRRKSLRLLSLNSSLFVVVFVLMINNNNNNVTIMFTSQNRALRDFGLRRRQ